MKILKESKKCFFTSILFTFLILLLLSGFVIVEKNIRHIAFGDNSLFMKYEFKQDNLIYISIHFMGNNYCIKI